MMLLSIVFAFIITLMTQKFTAAVDVGTDSPKDRIYLEVIHRSMANIKNFDVSMAYSGVINLNDTEMYNRPINGRNLLHHTIDIYMQNTNHTEREMLVTIMMVMVEKGARVAIDKEEEPDILVKSLAIREMYMATQFAQYGLPRQVKSGLLRLLYSVPCDAVPLAKLLLHAHSIIKNLPKGRKSLGGKEGVKNFVNNAKLPIGSKASVRGSDMSMLSKTYNNLLSKLGTNSLTESGILLTEIIDILDQVSTPVHEYVLLPRDGDNVLIADDANPEMKADAGALEFKTDWLLEIDEYGRNPLHILMLSGSKIMLFSVIDKATYDHKDKGGVDIEKKLKFVKALSMKDNRGNTPMDYFLQRYSELKRGGSGNDGSGDVGVGGKGNSNNKVTSQYVDRKEIIDQLKTLLSSVNIPFDSIVSFDAMKLESCSASSTNEGKIMNKNEENDDLNTGGWNTAKIDEKHLKNIDLTRCDIPQITVNDFTGLELFEKYINTGTPVMLRGLALNSPIRQAFTKDNLLAKFGTESVPIAVLPYAGRWMM